MFNPKIMKIASTILLITTYKLILLRFSFKKLQIQLYNLKSGVPIKQLDNSRCKIFSKLYRLGNTYSSEYLHYSTFAYETLLDGLLPSVSEYLTFFVQLFHTRNM